MLNDISMVYSESPVLFAGSALLIGLLVGSFLNVVIYRLPIILDHEWRAQASDLIGNASSDSELIDRAAPFSLSAPRSACPVCKVRITAWQNIPVISWIVLRGRCAACNTKISMRYPMVELGTGVLSAWVAWHFGFGVSAACALPVTWALIALTGIDIDQQLLPDNITLPLTWGGLLAAVAIGGGPGYPIPLSAGDAIVGATAGYLSLWLVFHAFRLATGKEGMGYGDFKLLAALGAWMGWQKLPLIILLSAGTGAIVGLLMIAFRGQDRTAPMPFGPYLAVAGWLSMLYGNTLVNGYLRLSGLQH